jgi:hypothetical protein
VEQLEEGNRWLHTDEHLAEVDKDRHQNEGVRRQVLKLDLIELQQCGEEGGYRRHETGCSIASKENELPRPEVGEWSDTAP